MSRVHEIVRRSYRAWAFACAAVAALLLFSVGCDTVEPIGESRLVIEGYLDSGEPLPAIHVRRTLSPAQAYDGALAAVDDAVLELDAGGSRIPYLLDESTPGTYRPANPALRLTSGTAYSFSATWHGTRVATSGVIPPEIHIADAHVSVPDEPVSAVLVDSLALFDSLSTGAYTGYIYPVEVTLHWTGGADEDWSEEESWVRAQLKPYSDFSSPVVDLFLKSEEIVRENEQPTTETGLRSWTGVYAVGVAGEDDPMPEHNLRISLVRSNVDYARFVLSKEEPERREPISNLDGAVGIFTAISVDSIHVRVQ